MNISKAPQGCRNCHCQFKGNSTCAAQRVPCVVPHAACHLPPAYVVLVARKPPLTHVGFLCKFSMQATHCRQELLWRGSARNCRGNDRGCPRPPRTAAGTAERLAPSFQALRLEPGSTSRSLGHWGAPPAPPDSSQGSSGDASGSRWCSLAHPVVHERL